MNRRGFLKMAGAAALVAAPLAKFGVKALELPVGEWPEALPRVTPPAIVTKSWRELVEVSALGRAMPGDTNGRGAVVSVYNGDILVVRLGVQPLGGYSAWVRQELVPLSAILFNEQPRIECNSPFVEWWAAMIDRPMDGRRPAAMEIIGFQHFPFATLVALS
jgi:hypothetical protein